MAMIFKNIVSKKKLMHFFISSQNYSLLSNCNKDCGCPGIFSPVCGRDNMQYFSACYAGCKRSKMEKASNIKVTEFSLS